MSVSSAQATTVVRNDPMRIAIDTIIAIAIISEATATLLRTGDAPKLAAASLTRRRTAAPSSATPARESPPIASGANSEPPKMISSPET